jgi:tetratricopeptide (TPR) repeat protein
MDPEVLGGINDFIGEEIYSKLGDKEKMLMKVASLFDRPFDADAAFIEEGLDFDTLQELRKKSLIRMVADGRYEAHEVIRSYFRNILTPNERKELAGRILPYLLEQGTRAKLTYRNDDALAFFSNVLNLEIENGGRMEAFEGLGDVLDLLGQYEKAVERFRSALELAKDKEVMARIHRKTGKVHHQAGRYQVALQCYERSLKLLLGERNPEAGKARLALAQILHRMGKTDESNKAAHEALDILKRFPGLENDMGKVHNTLGLNYIYGHKQDLKEAERHLLTSLDLRRTAHNLLGEATARNNLGIVYIFRGDGEKALEHLNEGLKLAEEIQSHINIVTLLFTMGCGHYELLGDFKKGEQCFRRALRISREVGDRYRELNCHWHLSRIFRFKGNLGKALKHSAIQLEMAKEHGGKRDTMEAHIERAKEFLAQGHLSDAMLSCLASSERADKLGDKVRAVECAKIEGAIFREQKEWEKARKSFEEALNLLKEIRHEYQEAMLYYDYALFWQAQGEKAKARKYGDRAIEMLEEQNVQWLVKRVKDDLSGSQ